MDALNHAQQAMQVFTIDAMRWMDLRFMLACAACTGALGMVNLLPWSVPLMKADEYHLGDLILIGIRRVATVVLATLVLVVVPLFYASTLLFVAPDAAVGHTWFMDYAGKQLSRYGWLPAFAGVFGAALRFGWFRYAMPWLSAREWSFARRQAVHDKSDMRAEAGKLKARQFLPADHYKPGSIFVGKGLDDKPVYVPIKLFQETHLQVLGPTRFGKGVVLGTVLEQAIDAGHGVVYVDPKADRFLPYILAAACERAGRKFVYIDLNSEHTRWAPFEGGSERDRRARIIGAFGLANAGDGADFYKSRERAILDTLLPKTAPSVAGIRSALDQRGPDGTPLKETANRLYDGLTEFAALPSLNPRRGGGNKVADALLAGATVYLRGSLDDATVRRATQVFIMEVIQEARRLSSERTSHLTLAIDELKFLISQEVSDVLATIAGFRVNMVLLHQSIRDLRAPEDRTLNVQALESGVLVNCQLKIIYRAADPETAEWASELSGTQIVRTLRSEGVTQNRYGGETYKGERTIAEEEVPIISTNQLLSLPPMVGVIYGPDRLAQVLFTSFVPTDTQRILYEPPKAKEAASAQELPATSPPPAAVTGAAPRTQSPPTVRTTPLTTAGVASSIVTPPPAKPAAATPPVVTSPAARPPIGTPSIAAPATASADGPPAVLPATVVPSSVAASAGVPPAGVRASPTMPAPARPASTTSPPAPIRPAAPAASPTIVLRPVIAALPSASAPPRATSAAVPLRPASAVGTGLPASRLRAAGPPQATVSAPIIPAPVAPPTPPATPPKSEE